MLHLSGQLQIQSNKSAGISELPRSQNPAPEAENGGSAQCGSVGLVLGEIIKRRRRGTPPRRINRTIVDLGQRWAGAAPQGLKTHKIIFIDRRPTQRSRDWANPRFCASGAGFSLNGIIGIDSPSTPRRNASRWFCASGAQIFVRATQGFTPPGLREFRAARWYRRTIQRPDRRDEH